MLKLPKNYRIPQRSNIWLRMPQVSCIIDKLPLSWKDFKHTLKHLKEELTLVELGSHLRIEESLRAHDNDKLKGNNVVGPSVVNMVEHNKSSRAESRVLRAVVRLLDSKLKTLGERGIECIFVGYARHSKAFRFYVIKPNDSVSINLIVESRDAIFDENRFSSVPRPSQRSLVKGTEDSGGLVVPEKVTEEVVQQPEPEPRKSKSHRTPKDFGHEFQLYLIEGTRDLISDQYSYCFNVEDDPKTFNEAMKSQDVTFWKEAIIDLMDSIMRNNTWVLVDLPPDGCETAFLNGELEEEVYMNQPHGFIMPGNESKMCKLINTFDKSGKRVIICLYVDDMLIFGTDQVQVDLTKEFLSSRFSMKNIGEADVILGILVILALNTDKQFNSNTKDNLSTSGRVFLFGGGAISWASKKQTCITGSIMESEFMALAAAGKEAEWLKNLLLEIPL
nr:zinc finger, CCHC-type [Tanacetum cinerariifolium]